MGARPASARFRLDGQASFVGLPARRLTLAAVTVEFLDPRAEPGLDARPYRLGLGSRLDQPGVVVGLLANSFADSEAFLVEVADALKEHLPDTTFLHYVKPNPSLLADDTLLERMVAECQAVVGAYGH